MALQVSPTVDGKPVSQIKRQACVHEAAYICSNEVVDFLMHCAGPYLACSTGFPWTEEPSIDQSVEDALSLIFQLHRPAAVLVSTQSPLSHQSFGKPSPDEPRPPDAVTLREDG